MTGKPYLTPEKYNCSSQGNYQEGFWSILWTEARWYGDFMIEQGSARTYLKWDSQGDKERKTGESSSGCSEKREFK